MPRPRGARGARGPSVDPLKVGGGSAEFDWDRLEALAAPAPIEKPPASITTQEYMERHKVSQAYASATLNRLVREGRMDAVMVRTPGKRSSKYYTLRNT